MMKDFIKTDFAVAGAIFLAIFSVYLLTLAPTIEIHDSAELISASWTLGIAHPAGSPLYCLLGKIFATIIPVGSIAFRYNVFSALCGALTSAGVFLFARRFSLPKTSAMLGALVLPFGATFWFTAVGAEVYTLNALLSLIALWRFFEWTKNDNTKNLALFGLSWGLLLSNHMGLSPLSPILWLIIILKIYKKNSAKEAFKGLLILSAFFLLGFSVYLYLPIRSAQNPVLDWGNPENLENLFDHITAKSIRERQFSLPAKEYIGRISEYFRILISQATIVGFLLFVVGFFALFKENKLFAGVLLLTLAMDGFFIVFLDSAPIASEAYGVPSALVISLAITFFIRGFSNFSKLQNAYVLRTISIIVLALPVFLLLKNYSVSNRSENFLIYDNALEMLRSAEPYGAILARDDNHIFPFAYLTIVENRRPDAEVIDRNGNILKTLYPAPLFRIPKEKQSEIKKTCEEDFFETATAKGRKIYTTTAQTDYPLDARYEFLPAGPLFLLTVKGRETVKTEPVRFSLRGEDKTHADWILEAALSMRAFNWGEYYWSLADAEGAYREWQRAGRTKSEYPEMHFLLGQNYLKKGLMEESLPALQTAVRLAPDLWQAWAQLGFANGVLGKYDEALDALSHAQKISPRSPEIFEYIGNIYLSAGRSELAVDAYRKALMLEPLNFSLRIRYAKLLARSGELEYAIEVLNEVKNGAPSELLKTLAILYETAGSFSDSVAVWREIENSAVGDDGALAQSEIERLSGLARTQ